jgi:hypothetical protein
MPVQFQRTLWLLNMDCYQMRGEGLWRRFFPPLPYTLITRPVSFQITSISLSSTVHAPLSMLCSFRRWQRRKMSRHGKGTLWGLWDCETTLIVRACNFYGRIMLDYCFVFRLKSGRKTVFCVYINSAWILLRWAAHVARMGENPKEGCRFEDLGVNGRVIGQSWKRMGRRRLDWSGWWRDLVNAVMNIRVLWSASSLECMDAYSVKTGASVQRTDCCIINTY